MENLSPDADQVFDWLFTNRGGMRNAVRSAFSPLTKISISLRFDRSFVCLLGPEQCPSRELLQTQIPSPRGKNLKAAPSPTL